MHVSRRGSITIQHGRDGDSRFLQMFGTSATDQEASLGLPLHASSAGASSLRVDQLEQSRPVNASGVGSRRVVNFATAGHAQHQHQHQQIQQIRQLQQRHPSQFAESRRSGVLNHGASASMYQPQESLQHQPQPQPRLRPEEHAAGLSPRSRSVIDSVYNQVDRSLDSMRSTHSMSIESALRHMRSRLPGNLDKLGEVAYDRLV